MGLRKEARLRGEKYYYTGSPCPNGHISKRSVSKGVCYECQIKSGSNWKINNKQKILEYNRYWFRNASPEQKEKLANRSKDRYERTKNTQRHKSMALYRVLKRKFLIKLAMPKWVDQRAIKEIYLNRPDGFDVDHIVPINGHTVCGLHVPWNLRYLPKSVNRRRPRKWENIMKQEAIYG